VDAVVEVPFGCAPHECYGTYEPFFDHMDGYCARVNGDPVGGMAAYLDEYVHGAKDWTDFLGKLGVGALLDAARRGRSIAND